MADRFMFFANFKEIADRLSDDLRLKFYDAMTDYVFKGDMTDDAVISALITAIKPSLDKEERRGGVREGAGRPKNNFDYDENQKKSKIIKNNQNIIKNNQKNQSFLETETETETENNIPPLPPKREKIKKLVDDDWQPNEATKSKLQAMGLDVPKVVEKFINSCQAKGLKYIDFNKAILAWDWSKDTSLQKDDDWDSYWEKMEEKYEQKVS